MGTTALITGASSGIGREIARIHASKKGDLIIVARRKEELEALKSELETNYGVSVTVVVADLSQHGAAHQVYQAIKEKKISVDYLINNAGFGGHGKFHEQKWEIHESMVNVNITALTALTYLFIPDMVANKRGRILNIASTAGFLPGPLQAVYYASKAYVLSLSQALAEELSDTPITVTALCPGPVKTGFAEAAHLEGVEMLKGNVPTAEDVAQIGYEAMLKGDLVKIDDLKLNILLNWILPFLPRGIVLKVSRRAMEKR